MLHQLQVGHDPVAAKPTHTDWSKDLDDLWQNMLEADHISSRIHYGGGRCRGN